MKIAIFDPAIGPLEGSAGRNLVVVVKVAAIFLESYTHSSGELIGRFMQTTTSEGSECDPGDEGFLYTVHLVQ